jgi:hypothetical protein
MSNELINIKHIGAQQSTSDEKIVKLRLGISPEKQEKLRILNLKNIEKENSQDLKNDRFSTLKSNSTTDIDRSVKEQDVSSGNFIDVFGSMQCPQQLLSAIKDIE